MTLFAPEAFGDAARAIDEVIASAVVQTRDVLVYNGCTDDELANEMHRFEAELVTWREKTLDDLRRWMDRGGEPLQ